MRKFTQKALSVLTLACLGSQAQAVGLGNIEVSSKLNQPLNARIKLMSIPRQDMQSLGNIKVRLASAEAFTRAGLERPPVLANLRFSVEGSGETTADIRISSSQPLKEPFVNFLLEVDWPNGRILREYTVLLDPPLYKAESSTPKLKTSAAFTEGTAPVKSQKTITSRPSHAPLPENVPVTGETYTVKKGDSLAGIANKMRQGSGISQKEMMQALLDANPDAFINRNINRLRSGVVLQTPALGNEGDQSAPVVTNQAQLNEYREQAAEVPETAPITTAQAPKKIPRPKPAAIKRPLEISGASGDGSGSASKGEGGQFHQQIQEIIEENKRIQQENKTLKEELAATKQLVDSMKTQLDALIKVQNDTLARLEQQAKGGQTAGATVAAAMPKTDSTKTPDVPKIDLKSDTNKPSETITKPDAKKDDWNNKTETKSDINKPSETITKPDAKKGEWGDKTEPKSDTNKPSETTETITNTKPDAKKDDWNNKTETKSDTSANVAQVPDSTKKIEEPKPPSDDKKDIQKSTDAPKVSEKSTPSEGEKGKLTPVKMPPPEEVGIFDSMLIMASEAGQATDNAVSAVPGGWWTVGGGVGIPLLGGLGWGAYRKRRAAQTDDELHNPHEDDELLQTGKDEFSDRDLELDEAFTDLDGEAPSFMGSDEILDEVDVYIEYERYDQALETLNHALEQHPDHEPYLIKRLEIDTATANTQAFEEHAQALHKVSGDQGENWQKAQTLWSSISNKPLNVNVSSKEKENSSGSMGLGTAAAIGVGAAGLAAAGLAAAGAFKGSDSEAGGDTNEFDSLDLNNLEEDGGELDFSSLDTSDANDLDFNLSSSDDDIPQTLDMDSLELGEEQDFNHGSLESSEDVNFLLNQEDNLNLHDDHTEESLDLNLDVPAHEEMDLSMNFDEDLEHFNLEETHPPEPIATSSSSQEEDMSFLLDDTGLDLGLDSLETAHAQTSKPESSIESEPSFSSSQEEDMSFLLDDTGLDLGLDSLETAQAQTSEPESSIESEPSFSSSQEEDMSFLLDDTGLDLGLDSLETAQAQTSEPESSIESELSLDSDFSLDDTGLDLGLDSLETEQTSEDEFALNTDDVSFDALNDLASEENALETAQTSENEFALNTDDISFDALNDLASEENALETAQTSENELGFDESFNLDSGDDLSLASLTEEELPVETNESLGDDFNLDMGSLEEDNIASLEMPAESPAAEEEFKLDDDFSDFNLGLESNAHDDLDLSLSADEQALLGDDFSLDLDGNFNLETGDETEGKFDLVQMYLESNDITSAQSTLEDIVKSGTPDQQARAKEVLKELGLV
jgi:pilus assembly protein FimV